MYNVVPLSDVSSISEIPQEKPFNLWLWLGIGAAAYLLLRKEKPKRKYEPSQTPADLHGLSGTLRTCDAWFETEDKRGFKTHRCFIYKPACNTKRCKIDINASHETISEMQGIDSVYPYNSKHDKGIFYIDSEPVYDKKLKKMAHRLYTKNKGKYGPSGIYITSDDLKKNFIPADSGMLSGYTATCRTWKKNKDGRRYCAKYAPTCNAAEEYGCRAEPAPVPGAKAKEFIPMDSVVKQIAKDIAYEYNERLDGARELMRKIKAYGGIAPYGGNYLREEYKDIPSKYKSENGIKVDELAQELGFDDERSLVNAINASEDEFNEMKAMQGGSKIRRFKTDDFLNTAYNRLVEEHGYSFSGLGQITKEVWQMTKEEFNKIFNSSRETQELEHRLVNNYSWQTEKGFKELRPDAPNSAKIAERNILYRGEYGDINHEDIIRQAVSEGKEVPFRILLEYPELIKKFKIKPEKRNP